MATVTNSTFSSSTPMTTVPLLPMPGVHFTSVYPPSLPPFHLTPHQLTTGGKFFPPSPTKLSASSYTDTVDVGRSYLVGGKEGMTALTPAYQRTPLYSTSSHNNLPTTRRSSANKAFVGLPSVRTAPPPPSVFKPPSNSSYPTITDNSMLYCPSYLANFPSSVPITISTSLPSPARMSSPFAGVRTLQGRSTFSQPYLPPGQPSQMQSFLPSAPSPTFLSIPSTTAPPAPFTSPPPPPQVGTPPSYYTTTAQPPCGPGGTVTMEEGMVRIFHPFKELRVELNSAVGLPPTQAEQTQRYCKVSYGDSSGLQAVALCSAVIPLLSPSKSPAIGSSVASETVSDTSKASTAAWMEAGVSMWASTCLLPYHSQRVLYLEVFDVGPSEKQTALSNRIAEGQLNVASILKRGEISFEGPIRLTGVDIKDAKARIGVLVSLSVSLRVSSDVIPSTDQMPEMMIVGEKEGDEKYVQASMVAAARKLRQSALRLESLGCRLTVALIRIRSTTNYEGNLTVSIFSGSTLAAEFSSTRVSEDEWKIYQYCDIPLSSIPVIRFSLRKEDEFRMELGSCHLSLVELQNLPGSCYAGMLEITFGSMVVGEVTAIVGMTSAARKSQQPTFLSTLSPVTSPHRISSTLEPQWEHLLDEGWESSGKDTKARGGMDKTEGAPSLDLLDALGVPPASSVEIEIRSREGTSNECKMTPVASEREKKSKSDEGRKKPERTQNEHSETNEKLPSARSKVAASSKRRREDSSKAARLRTSAERKKNDQSAMNVEKKDTLKDVQPRMSSLSHLKKLNASKVQDEKESFCDVLEEIEDSLEEEEDGCILSSSQGNLPHINVGETAAPRKKSDEIDTSKETCVRGNSSLRRLRVDSSDVMGSPNMIFVEKETTGSPSSEFLGSPTVSLASQIVTRDAVKMASRHIVMDSFTGEAEELMGLNSKSFTLDQAEQEVKPTVFDSIKASKSLSEAKSTTKEDEHSRRSFEPEAKTSSTLSPAPIELEGQKSPPGKGVEESPAVAIANGQFGSQRGPIDPCRFHSVSLVIQQQTPLRGVYEPHCWVGLGNFGFQSKVLRGFSDAVCFQTSFLLPYSGEHDVELHIRDFTRDRDDRVIGAFLVDFLPLFQEGRVYCEQAVELMGADDEEVGILSVFVEFCEEAAEEATVESSVLPFSTGENEDIEGELPADCFFFTPEASELSEGEIIPISAGGSLSHVVEEEYDEEDDGENRRHLDEEEERSIWSVGAVKASQRSDSFALSTHRQFSSSD